MGRPALGDQAATTIKLWEANLSNLVDGDGSAIVTQEQVDAIEGFLDHLSAIASPQMQELIADERTRLGPLDDYVGLSVLEAKLAAIGDAISYLPMITAR